MPLTLTLLCTIVTLCCCSSFVTPKDLRGFYTIVAPGTIRSHSTYHVSISLSDFNQSCSFAINILVFGQGIEQIEEAVEVQPGTTKLVKLQIPAIKSSDGMLSIIGFKGIISQDMGVVIVEQRHYTAYIQTDKPKYRPGELMQFRVICLDRLTRPAYVTENLLVQIVDAERNTIKEFQNIKLVQGVFKSSLAISEHPNLGNWDIRVLADGQLLQTRTVSINKYTLPSFSVTITTKEDVALAENELELSIKSSYTYGEAVKGNLTLIIHTTYSPFEPDRPDIRREMQIDGEVAVKLDFKTDLNVTGNSSDHRSIRLYTLDVEVIVQDELTNRVSNAKVPVNIHNHPYRIKVDALKLFNPLRLVNITIILTDLHGNRVQDSSNPVEIILEGSRFSDNSNLTLFKWEENKISYLGKPTVERRKLFLDENGVAGGSFNLTDERFTEFEVKAVYLGWMSRTEKLLKKEDVTFELDILTDKPEVNQELVVRLTSIDPIDHFVCDVISRGNIIQTNRTFVPDNATSYLIRVPIDYSMVPRIFLFVHRIKGNSFSSKLKEVFIKEALENSINITCAEEVKPGSEVSLNVTTDEGSYVGLMGLDHRLLIDEPNADNFTEEQIIADLRNFDSQIATVVEQPGVEAGLLTFSNAYDCKGSEIGTGFAYIGGIQPATPDRAAVELPRIRELFAESWIFKDFEKSPKDGLTLREKIPDTITSWAITGFSLNPSSGFSLTKNVTNLKVFQEFFISMDLPYSIKEGEILEIQVFVFNYMEENMPTDITIDNPDGNLQFLDDPSTKSSIQTNKIITKSIAPKGREELKFLVKGHRVGKHNVTVRAISRQASDAIRKLLIVEPVGVPQTVSRTYLVHFPQRGKQEDEIEIDIPAESVKNSEIINLSVVGDIFGLLTRSLEKIARVPYGNAKQNMDYFMSNLLVLKYLKTLNHSNPSLEIQTKLHLDLGLQNLLTFKQLDGSFSIFDRRKERTGDIWLTAYVLWGFIQADPEFHIDSDVIKRTVYYLTQKQNKKGAFTNSGRLEDDIMLTSLVAISLLDRQEYATKEKETIDKALSYIHERLNDLKQPELKALPIYALMTAKHNQSEELVTNLNTQGIVSGKVVMWFKKESLQSSLEATAAGFMNLFESQGISAQNWLPIVQALVSAKQADKFPTQMIALEGMIRFARDINFGDRNLKINFTDDQGRSGDFQVDTGNSQVLQTIGLNETSRKVKLRTEGLGFAIVSLSCKYNVVVEDNAQSGYKVNLTIPESTNTFMAIKVCISKHLINVGKNLTAVEVYLPSGYSINEKLFEKIEETNEQVEGVQLNGNEGSVLVYYSGVSQSGICVRLEAVKSFSVLNAKPISVIVYDAQEEDERSISFYEVK